MNAIVLSYILAVGDQMYASIGLTDAQGNVTGSVNLPLGVFPITKAADVLAPLQTALTAYAQENGLGALNIVDLTGQQGLSVT